MTTFAKQQGQFKPEMFQPFDRLQIVTVQQILDGERMNLPLVEALPGDILLTFEAVPLCDDNGYLYGVDVFTEKGERICTGRISTKPKKCLSVNPSQDPLFLFINI